MNILADMGTVQCTMYSVHHMMNICLDISKFRHIQGDCAP